MPPGAPAHMRAAAGLRTHARAAARAQPVHIHGFCTLPRLHRDDAESGSYDQLLTWCACTHAVSCVFVLAAWRHAYMHKSRCVLGFLHARHAGGSHVPTTQPSRARTSPGARRRTRTQELPCAASPPRQCCQHDSQATRRAAARCPHGDMRAHAGAAVRGVSPTTKPIRPTAVRPSSGAHTHMRAIATVCRLHSTVSTSQGQPRAASPPADDVAPPGDVLAKPNWLINQSSIS